MDGESAIAILSGCFQLDKPDITIFVLECFYNYFFNFLQYHPNVLDPHFPHIQLRFNLSTEHPTLQWHWTQQGPEVQQTWGHDDHAAVFVLSILDYVVSNGHCAHEYNANSAINEIHRWLCILQSVWLENGAWFDDKRLQRELRDALVVVMEEIYAARQRQYFGLLV